MDSSWLPPTFPGCCLQSRRHWASASVGSDFLKLRVLEKPPALWHKVGGPVTGGGAGCGAQASDQTHFFLVGSPSSSTARPGALVIQ